MKKIALMLTLLLVLAGCASQETPAETTTVASTTEAATEASSESTEAEAATEEAAMAKTMIYASEHGDIEVPTNPERIIVLDSSAMGSMLMFDGDVIGHELWSGSNPLFAEGLSGSTEVAVGELEQILALKPDLIVTSPYNENFEELSKIAPTVSFSYGRLSYTDTIIEYGKLVNQEAAAKAWVDDYKARSAKAGEAMKAKYGEDVSVSVLEAYGDEMYLYGDNWGRGTQVLYQEMGLKMTDAVKEVALTDGYYAISAEVVPDYAADLMVLTYFEGSNLAFEETETWKNIEAVQNGQVLKVPAESFYMTGPITLDYQLKTIEEFYLK